MTFEFVWAAVVLIGVFALMSTGGAFAYSLRRVYARIRKPYERVEAGAGMTGVDPSVIKPLFSNFPLFQRALFGEAVDFAYGCAGRYFFMFDFYHPFYGTRTEYDSRISVVAIQMQDGLPDLVIWPKTLSRKFRLHILPLTNIELARPALGGLRRKYLVGCAEEHAQVVTGFLTPAACTQIQSGGWSIECMNDWMLVYKEFSSHPSESPQFLRDAERIATHFGRPLHAVSEKGSPGVRA